MSGIIWLSALRPAPAAIPFAASRKTVRPWKASAAGFPCLPGRPWRRLGIDVYKKVAQAGWDIYPISSRAKPEDMPKGTLAGIIMVQ
jgi:hypothetical protein